MKAVLKRPFVLFCVIFLLACATCFYSSIKVKIALIVSALLFICAAVIIKVILKKVLRDFIKFTLIFSLALILSSVLCLFAYNKKAESQISLADGKNHTITAYVKEFENSTAFSTFCSIKVTEVDGKKVSFDAILSTEFVFDIDTFQEFKMNVTFLQIEKDSNGFPLRLYYNSKGCFISAVSDDIDFTTGKKVKKLTSVFKNINEGFDDILSYNLSDEGYEIASTVLLGNRKNLSDSLKRDFATLGVSHLLAVSGIHITIILGFFSFVFSFFSLSARKKHILLILLALMFMGVTGFSPSVSRAGIMFIIFCLAEIFGYRNDSLTSLFAAVTLICVISPSSIYDVGLLLSFFATLGIVTLGTEIQIRLGLEDNFIKRGFAYLINSVSTTVSATVFTLPVMWIFFGHVSVVSPLSNLIYIPLVTLILIISPLVIITAKIPFLCSFLSFLISEISKIIFTLSKQAKYLKDYKVNLEYDFVLYILLVFILLFAVIILIRKKSKSLYFVPILFFVVAFGVCVSIYNHSQKGTVDLLYIKDKKNEAFVIKDGDITFIDMSTGGLGNIRIAKNEISKKLYGTNIDNYMLTHYHKLHISTFNSLCENYYIEKLILPEPITESDREVFVTLCESALERDIEIIVYEHYKSSDVTFKNATFDIMEYVSIKRSTHPLLSMRITANGQTISYFGASSHEANSVFIENNNKSDLVIFGVHGPVYKSSFDFDSHSKYATALYGNSDVKSFISTDLTREIILQSESETFFIRIPAK